MGFRARVLGAACALVVLSSADARGENWPQWRGPAFNGSTTETNLPVKFGPNENVAWVAHLPGVGASTPVVWGDAVFLTAQEPGSNQTLALCLNASDGSVRWQQVIGKGFTNRQGNTAASPSPIVDGERVIFPFGTGDLAAFDFDGKRLWSRNIAADHGRFEMLWDYAASPLLWEARLYIPVLHGNERAKATKISYLLAVDPKSGRDLWKMPRLSDAEFEAKQAYTTPYPFQGPDGWRILLTGADYVTAHDPATGREIWRSPSYNPKNEKAYRTVASPVASDNVVLASAPRGGDLYALALGRGAHGAASRWTWTVARDAPDVPTPLAVGGRFFVLEGNGRYLFCVEPASGRVLWRERLEARAPFQASPTAGDGKIYCLSMKGDVFVVAAADTFQVLHQTQFDSKDCRASIAIAGGRLFIRTDRDLYCIGGKN